MKHKRLFAISTALVYLVFMILCLAYAFSVKHINSEYIMQADSVRYEKVESILSDCENKNLCFVNLKKIKNKIEKDAYLKVLKIEKKFPNSINVTVEERKEMFEINVDGQYFVLDENYFVLAKKSVSGDNVKLELEESVYDKNSLKIKGTFKLVAKEMENCIAKMLDNFSDWKNLLTKIKIEAVNSSSDNYRVTFYTTQGCQIEIRKAKSDGEQKVMVAINAYKQLTDLEKTDSKIIAFYSEKLGQVTADIEKITIEKENSND